MKASLQGAQTSFINRPNDNKDSSKNSTSFFGAFPLFAKIFMRDLCISYYCFKKNDSLLLKAIDLRPKSILKTG
jgi:hypothetical protein